MNWRDLILTGSVVGLMSVALLLRAEGSSDRAVGFGTSPRAQDSVKRIEIFSTPSAKDRLPNLSSGIISIIVSVKAPIGDRLRAVHALGHNLAPEDITALYDFLNLLPSGEKNLRGLHVLKNDILNALRDQTVPPRGLTDTLLGIYSNRAQDNVTRDYAIQHLVAWYEQGAPDAPSAIESIPVALEQAAHEANSIAGTALLGMHRLATCQSVAGRTGFPTLIPREIPVAFHDHKIRDRALALASSSETPVATRITALQVCGERAIKDALPVAQALAQKSISLPLQLSAIAALSRLGGPEQAALLQPLESTPNESLRIAVRAALKRLQQKQPLL